MNSNYRPYSYNNYNASNFSSYQNYPYKIQNQNDERLVGGFLGPFILGGITGGLVSPFFYGGYGNNNRPPVYYYQPGPYRPPYYGPGIY